MTLIHYLAYQKLVTLRACARGKVIEFVFHSLSHQKMFEMA